MRCLNDRSVDNIYLDGLKSMRDRGTYSTMQVASVLPGARGHSQGSFLSTLWAQMSRLSIDFTDDTSLTLQAYLH